MTSVRINNVDYPVSLPFSVCQTHEGGLDQAAISLRHTDVSEPFAPYTRAYFEGEWWVIANDHCVHEKYINKYTHDIQLVELAKELEGVVCGAKTFTDPLCDKPIFVQIDSTPRYTIDWHDGTTNSGGALVFDDENWELDYETEAGVENSVKNPGYKTPVMPSTIVLLPALECEWADKWWEEFRSFYSLDDGPLIEFKEKTSISLFADQSLRVKYTARYLAASSTSRECTSFEIDCISFFPDVIKRSPLTVYEVTERLLIAAETTSDADERRYVHAIAEQINVATAIDTRKIDAPELSFPNSATLKENLDQIAKTLHAKTKLVIRDNDQKAYVFFVPLTIPEMANIGGVEISGETTFDISKYAGRVETNASNMTFKRGVHAIDPVGIATPGKDTYQLGKGLRAKDTEARIDEKTGEIETSFPIKRIVKLLARHPFSPTLIDITDFVCEESAYVALSSYAGGRCYSLYFTRGSKNVKGLFFEQENAISQKLEKYSIQNILEEKGVKIGLEGNVSTKLDRYADLSFVVEYEPYIDLRLINSHTDGHVASSVTLVANQVAQEMDKDALGDFVYGTIHAMGAAARKKTFLFGQSEHLPKVGTLYSDDVYITEITYERNPYYTKATLTLSEKFNQLGQHVEVSNAVREYEISTKNIFNRNIVYADFCTISRSAFNGKPSILTEDAKKAIIRPLGSLPITIFPDERLSFAALTTYIAENSAGPFEEFPGLGLPDPKKAVRIRSVLLPVLGFGFGNSLSFSAFFEDNYSAGRIARTAQNYSTQEYVSYCDAYGCADFLDISFGSGVNAYKETDLIFFARQLPIYPEKHFKKGSIDFGKEYAHASKLYLCKDSRERIVFTYQLLFESNCELIIGRDFCNASPLVCDYHEDTESESRLELYSHKIDPISGSNKKGDVLSKEGLFHTLVDTENGTPKLFTYLSPPEHKAWAITWKGMFLLGSNKPLEGKDTFYFNFHHK